MRITNPAFKSFTSSNNAKYGEAIMTVHGAVNKVAILLIMMLASGLFTWCATFNNAIALGKISGVLGMIGGLILGLITIFKRDWAPKTAPIYAVCQGLFLGSFSASFEASFPGITFIVLGLTSGTAAAILLAYQFNLVQATENFKLMLLCATGAVAFMYTIALILGLFGIKMPLIHDCGIYGIAFSLIVIAIAAFNLILDFDLIEKGAESGLPKHMEWYAAFSVLVTLIWLYMEVFRLVLKLLRKK